MRHRRLGFVVTGTGEKMDLRVLAAEVAAGVEYTSVEILRNWAVDSWSQAAGSSHKPKVGVKSPRAA